MGYHYVICNWAELEQDHTSKRLSVINYAQKLLQNWVPYEHYENSTVYKL